MAGHEAGWGAALQSLGSSLGNYAEVQRKAKQDADLAAAIVAKEDKARQEALDNDYRSAILEKYKSGGPVVANATPEVNFPSRNAPVLTGLADYSYLNRPTFGTAPIGMPMPDPNIQTPAPMDISTYLGGNVPAQPERLATPEESNNWIYNALRKQTTPGFSQKPGVDYKQLALNLSQEKLDLLKNDGSQYSPDGVDLAAQQYLATGIMPALGMGQSPVRAQIINKAAELSKNKGQDNSNVPSERASFKADTNSLTQLTKIRDNTLSFEKQAVKNFDLADGIAKTLDNQGNTVFNRWYSRKVKGEAIGDPQQRNFDLALNRALMEYAKVTTGGAASIAELSQTAQQEIKNFLDSGESYAAFKSRIEDVIKPEMRNREQSFNEQIAEINGRLKGGNTPLTTNTDRKSVV